MSDSQILDAIATMRGEILAGHNSLRCELGSDLAKLQQHVDDRIDAIERMVQRIADDHNVLRGVAHHNAERISKLEAELVILRSVRNDVDALDKRVRAIDRDISDADMASRLRDSQHEADTGTVVEAMRITVERLTRATHEALERTEAVTARAEVREAAAAAQSAHVATLAASVRKDSWRKQVATMAIVVLTGALGAAFSHCNHGGDADKKVTEAAP